MTPFTTYNKALLSLDMSTTHISECVHLWRVQLQEFKDNHRKYNNNNPKISDFQDQLQNIWKPQKYHFYNFSTTG